MAIEISEFEKGILQQIDGQKISVLLQELVKIPSPNPPGDTRAVADFVADALEKQGIRATCIRKDEAAVNVVGRIKGSGGGKSLLLNAHLDTVPVGDTSKWTVDPFGGELRSGRLYGRGATDCKGGAAAIVSAAQAVLKAQLPLRGDIILTLVAGEETLSEEGTAYLLKGGYADADGVIIAESSTLPSEKGRPPLLQIFIASRGMALFEITSEGKSVHAKVAPTGINAIEKMAKIIEAFQNSKFEKHLGHPLCGKPTFNVGLIQGGTSPNMVPDFCRITLNRNTIPGEKGEAVHQEITNIISDLQEKDKDLKATVKPLYNADPVEISENEEIVELLKGAIQSVIGTAPNIGGMIGTNDNRFFIKKGIPAVVCGPGTIPQCHAVDEYVEIEALLNATKVYALSMIRFCR
jgi:acetylornithine deacetylase/succinyl-diaminopimelate desuccinylase family protein